MKVSIITVVRNAKKTIEQTINSVLNQTYKNIEYIIIDGLSTDGTQEIIKQYENQLAYYVSEADQGLYDAMNKGIQHARGDIIGIINSDDWYECDAIKKIVNVFEKYDTELVHGNVNMIRAENEKWVSKPAPVEQLWQRMVIMHPTVFIKKKIYDQFGVFDTHYKIAADYELMLRLYSKKVKFYYIDEIIANFRWGGISVKLYRETEKEALQVAKKYFRQSPDLTKTAMLLNETEKLTKLNDAITEQPSLLEHIIKSVWNNAVKDIVIFGAGIWGARYGEILSKTNLNIICFYDNNRNNRDMLCGKEIKSFDPDKIINFPVLIAIRKGTDEVIEQLKRAGVKYYVTINMLAEQYSKFERK